MKNFIIGQHYYQRNKDNEFEGFLGMADLLSPYSKKIYATLNDIILESKVDRDIDKLDSLLISEMVLSFFTDKDDKEVYVSADELVEDCSFIKDITKCQLSLTTGINAINSKDEVSKLLEIFQISARKDVAEYIFDKTGIVVDFNK